MENNQRKRIINSCQTCRNPIYEGEPVYASSKGQTSGYSSGVAGGVGKGFGYGYGGGIGTYGGHHKGEHSSENWAQCAWCYDRWQAKVNANWSFWWKWWLGGILFILILTIISVFLFPSLEKEEIANLKNNDKNLTHFWRFPIFWKVSLGHFIIFFAGIALVGILGYFLQPKVDRYKIRVRPN